MRLYLSGIALLDEQSIGFAVPFFTNRNSNLNYAQDLDENFIVGHFKLFDPDKYFIMPSIGHHIYRQVGEQGLLCYRTKSELLIGSVNTLKSLLSSASLDEIGGEFACLEVAYFFEREAEIKERIEIASSSINDPRLKLDWTNIEAYGAQQFARRIEENRLKKGISFWTDDLIIQHLKQFPKSHDWHILWRKIWGKVGENVEIVNITSNWMMDNRDHIGFPHVLITVLTTRGWHHPFQITARAMCEGWLRQNPNDATWSTIWLLAARVENISLSSYLIEAGHRYLNYSIEGASPASPLPPNWSKIWSRLNAANANEDALLSSAYYAIIEKPPSLNIINTVLLQVIGSSGAPTWSYTYARQWLRDNKSPDTLWVALFKKVYLHADEELENLAFEWLATKGNTNAWYSVWRILRARLGYTERLVAAAESWLSKSNKRLTAHASLKDALRRDQQRFVDKR